MKRIICVLLMAAVCFSLTACSRTNHKQDYNPSVTEMKAICELATMECYYHNVAKYSEEDASGILWWEKDRKFWIEYAGIVTVGIDASFVKIDVDGEKVTITIPPAKVLGCRVDEESLTADSVIVGQNSAKVKSEHQTVAYKEAQENMRAKAASDTALLASAQQCAQRLLENYVNSIGDLTQKNYQIEWIYLDDTEKTPVSSETTEEA